MRARFDLVVLDLDGTLVDSQDILVATVNETLVSFGHPTAAPRVVAATIGLALSEVFRQALASADDATIEALCAHFRQRVHAPEFVSRFRLFDGVVPTLERLRAAGIRLVVATSKGRAATLDILRHCTIDVLMDGVLGGDSVSCGKPHPEMVHRARALFGIAPARTLMVGDTSFDVQMGHAAGVATCAVTYGMHAAESLRALRPDLLIDRFDALPDWLLG